MACGLPNFIDEIPDYAVRDGRMHITMGPVVIVMPIHIFLGGCQNGKTAIADWMREKRGSVVPIRVSAEH